MNKKSIISTISKGLNYNGNGSDSVSVLQDDDADMILFFHGTEPFKSHTPEAYYKIIDKRKSSTIEQRVKLEQCSSYHSQFWALVYALNAASKMGDFRKVIICGNMHNVICIMCGIMKAEAPGIVDIALIAFKLITHFTIIEFIWFERKDFKPLISNKTERMKLNPIHHTTIDLEIPVKNNKQPTKIIFNRKKLIAYSSKAVIKASNGDIVINSNKTVIDKSQRDTVINTSKTVIDNSSGDIINAAIKKPSSVIVTNNYKTNIEKSRGGIKIELESNEMIRIKDQRQIIQGYMIMESQNCNTSFHGITVVKGCEVTCLILGDSPNTFKTIPFLFIQNKKVDFILEYTTNPKEIGKVENQVQFNFDCGSNFSIGRFITITYSEDKVIKEMLASPKNPHKKKSRIIKMKDNQRIIKGVPLLSNKSKTYHSPARYTIPKSFEQRKLKQVDLLNRYKELSTDNNMKGYQNFYHDLLWLEEKQTNYDMIQYEIENAILGYNNNYHSLKVEGLAEKRPSLLKNDTILVEYKNKTYEAYIHRVEKLEIFVKFHYSFNQKYIRNEKCNVKFRYSRSLFRIYHQSLDQMKIEMLNFINPIQKNTNINVPINYQIQKIDKNLNDIQISAVKNILQMDRSLHAPYIIFGPPGTGKTSTMVEAIKQMGKIDKNTKILICAPSNSAANLLLKRLSSSINPREMFRLMAYQADISDETEADITNILEYCLYNNNEKVFDFPDLEKLKSYQYIICTCSMAGKLFNYGVTLGHFNAVFIDESCYAIEPEIIGSFSYLLDITDTITSTNKAFNSNNQKLFNGLVVLAGDPKQLGPIIRNPLCGDLGGKLNISLLERLIEINILYKCDLIQYPDTVGYNPKYITMLLDCYRCHPDILHIPNKLFYNNKLRPVIRSTDSLVDWEELPIKSVPILFYGVEGENQQEDTSPSWFNISELEIILVYLEKLRTEKVHMRDIAVITPYFKQKKKLEELIKKKNKQSEYKDLLIGSCEIMQGKERRVVIISTVRSSLDYLNKDIYYNLGFLSNPKRFNVAITRAKSLLIVIGNPHVLMKDYHWGSLLHYIKEKGNCKGCTFPNYEYNETTRTFDINDNLQDIYVKNTNFDDILIEQTDFGKGFKKPIKSSIWLLELNNKHPNDKYLTFDEKTHQYSYNNKLLPRSVTHIIKKYFEEFDSDKIIDRMMNGGNRPKPQYMHPDGTIFTREQIKEQREIAKNRGIWLHHNIDRFLNKLVISSNIPEMEQFRTFYEDIINQQKITPYRTEWHIAAPDIGLGGSVDFVGKYKDGNYVLMDWKRSLPKKLYINYNNAIGPLKHMPDCKYSKYALQLNIYRYILIKYYKMNVSKMILALFHPDNNEYFIEYIPVLETETENVLNDMNNNIQVNHINFEIEDEEVKDTDEDDDYEIVTNMLNEFTVLSGENF